MGRMLLPTVPRSVVIPRIMRMMRLGRKMTQTALAAKLLVTPNYIYLLENGRKFPSLKFCIRFAEYFEMNPNWIKTAWLRDYVSWVRVKMESRLGLAAML